MEGMGRELLNLNYVLAQIADSLLRIEKLLEAQSVKV